MAGALCRPSQGACDDSEYCSGSSPECPPDLVVSAGMVCTTCQQTASCDGVAATCPPATGPCPGSKCSATGGEAKVGLLLALGLRWRRRSRRF